jgi:hypothetical protein
VNTYVLTRTSNRPRAFARLRADLLAQDYDGRIIHVVHSDDPNDQYAEGDIVIHGERVPRGRHKTAPWERYNLALLEAVKYHGIPGFITFMDDDDTYTSSKSVATMMRYAIAGVMPIWKVERENGRISPTEWMSDLNTPDGRICWEASTFHTDYLPLALAIGIDEMDGGDGRFWARMSESHQIAWIDAVLTRPQEGKGKGRRRDVAP